MCRKICILSLKIDTTHHGFTSDKIKKKKTLQANF